MKKRSELKGTFQTKTYCDTHQQDRRDCMAERLDNINSDCPICQDIESGGCVWWGRKVSDMPAHLLAAIEGGVMTEEQLRELAVFEAAELGLTLRQALEGIKDNTLPHNALGSDIRLLAMMLEGRCESITDDRE